MGRSPRFFWALALLPLGWLAFTVIGNWEEKDRIREAWLDGDTLVLRVIFRPPRRVKLSALSDWKLDRLVIRNHEGPDGYWWTLCAREREAGKRWYFLVDGARIDLDAFRFFAPVAVADLEKLHVRSRGKGCDYGPIGPAARTPEEI